jgi:carboxylesterase type B
VQWIYGGAWILGDNYEFGLYDATKLAGDHKV